MIDSRFSDSQLVSLYQNGNEAAFEMLLHRHKSRIYTAIYLIVKDRYIAEDLLQETFIKAVNTIKSGRYNEEGKFLPWLSRVGHNLAIDYFRRSKRYPEIVLEDGVWIGAKAIVCPGVTCFSHSVLTVSSVATKNLEAFTIYQGNPAVKIKIREIKG